MIEPTKGNAGKADATENKGLMIEYGITNIPVDCFHIGGFKYTNLKDAISQAKRLQA
ncbi:MAG: hypothetical protein RH946_07285 [Rhodospirillales bacterium]|tara:strand:- start:367 stop:537 length:171 start_codon:yes stop_codon:yes gene_type:complete